MAGGATAASASSKEARTAEAERAAFDYSKDHILGDGIRIPHMGWNEVDVQKDSVLFADRQPDARRTVQNSKILLWIVPARVEGTWQLRTEGGEARLTLRQQFQQVSGTIAANGRSVPLRDVQLRGPQIAFAADLGGGSRRFVGSVDGAAMAGEGWQATRIGN